MSIAALGVAALGNSLGTLLGSSLSGGPEYGFKDTKKETSVTQLDPAQLDQILQDLTNAEATARGDVQAGYGGALGMILGDTNYTKRMSRLQEEQQNQFDAVNTYKSAYSDLAQAKIDLEKAQKSADYYGNWDLATAKKYVTDNYERSWINTPQLEAKASNLLDYFKTTTAQTLEATKSKISNLQNTLENSPSWIKDMDFKDILKLDAESPVLARAAESNLRQSNPDLFSTEFTSGSDQFDAISNRFVDPYLTGQQGFNTRALEAMEMLAGIRQPERDPFQYEEFQAGQGPDPFQEQQYQATDQELQQAFDQSPEAQQLRQYIGSLITPGQQPTPGELQQINQQITQMKQQLFNQFKQNHQAQFNQQQDARRSEYDTALSAFNDSEAARLAQYNQNRQAALDEYNVDPRLTALRNTPGYQFAFDEGQRALDFANSAAGTVNSGRAVRGAIEFGQGLASTTLNQQYDRLAQLVNSTSNASIAGAGQYQSGKFAAADILANQGTGLAGIAQAAAANRSNAILQGGTKTTDSTLSQLFNIDTMQPVVR